VRKLFLLFVGAGVAAAVAASMPDIKRYLAIRRM